MDCSPTTTGRSRSAPAVWLLRGSRLTVDLCPYAKRQSIDFPASSYYACPVYPSLICLFAQLGFGRIAAAGENKDQVCVCKREREEAFVPSSLCVIVDQEAQSDNNGGCKSVNNGQCQNLSYLSLSSLHQLAVITRKIWAITTYLHKRPFSTCKPLMKRPFDIISQRVMQQGSVCVVIVGCEVNELLQQVNDLTRASESKRSKPKEWERVGEGERANGVQQWEEQAVESRSVRDVMWSCVVSACCTSACCAHSGPVQLCHPDVNTGSSAQPVSLASCMQTDVMGHTLELAFSGRLNGHVTYDVSKSTER